ncbi:TetR/AcrR family transcriptional regulator [Pseudooceanicola sp.]|uniref:TetR/AcrR family transcriptional regulator n=1 Tax=Pseudooceanicola sp. TaxID=1914328 RepID=UPI002611B994|nr:TetR/AcrR family transcriptional regulator [Pseudooceanicola sp.]MDF1853866.1 helix-turn-helix domain containing protein [Pseudooceanicola sp.]
MDHQRRIGGAEGVRARALAAASLILSEGGTGKLSLRGIAERAGIGLASIYHHFDSKEDILLRLALRGFVDLHADLEACRITPGPQGPMRSAARAYLTFADRRAPLFALMFDPRMLSRHEKLREAERGAFAHYERAVLADDRLPNERRADAAAAVWALGRGMMAVNASYPGGRMPREMADRMSRGVAWLLDREDLNPGS